MSAGEPTDADWPLALRGVTESVVATEGPNGRWNLAALGLHAGDPVTARTWGRTRTRLNFDRRGGGVVQFTRDPVDFTRAALDVYERQEPVLDSARAWARVEAERVTTGDDGSTEWADWRLHPVESAVESRSVEPVNRAFGAVVEATVAASRLDVPSYDETTLRQRLSYFEAVVERCGGKREREAMALIGSLTDWKTENESF
ncbi:DUF447 domain-containing protein [Haloarchaeobius iranensis]|uniref:DUF447 family protein n=1 Tax=Haloarchaeobius iranensis TaxID=996166 RepID=A0A1G9W5X8_9EURY|nr:DUF447 domain-containing protein [Haloarchaeobius iranensis]SDM79938.1 hypothetical protein SAMN05192554_107175 [Haloarchaeobius iranensis]